MLHVYFGEMQDVVYNTEVYFRNTYLDEWLDDAFAQRMIKDVDKATVIGPRLIDSKALGKIPPVDLSGGVKTLLLIWNQPDKVFNASNCGDNCAKWLLRIAEKRDVTVNLHHIMDFGSGTFEIEVLNSGVVVHDMGEFVVEAVRALRPSSDGGSV